MDFSLRVDIQLLEAAMQQAVSLQQQFDFIPVQADLVPLVLANQMIQGRGQLRHRQHTGHVGAALEGMHGALQVVAGRQR